MKNAGDMVSYTADELRAMIARGEDQTVWARVDAMTEEELEAAIATDPDWAEIPPDWYEHATPHYPEAVRKEVRLRLDSDLLAWFKRQGPAIGPGSTPRSAPSSRPTRAPGANSSGIQVRAGALGRAGLPLGATSWQIPEIKRLEQSEAHRTIG